MTREKVDELLKAYRFEVGRCGHLETEIAQLQKAIACAMKNLTEDMSAVAKPLSGMPRGTDISSPTEKIAIMLASGWVPDHVDEMQRELEVLQREYDDRYFTVLFVGSWLNGLTEREQWIVKRQMIDGETWRDIGINYRANFGEEVSKDKLRRLKWRALKKIYQMAE